MKMIFYVFTLISLAIYAGSTANNNLQLPITISPLVQNSVQFGNLTHSLIADNQNFFAHVTFSDVVKNLRLPPLPQIKKNFLGIAILGLAAESNGLSINQFEFRNQSSPWLISMTVEELANASRNIKLPLDDEIPLIIIQKAMFKILEKRFNFKTEEAALSLNTSIEEVYAFLEPGWIKTVNYVTKKNILHLSENYTIPPFYIAEALNMSLSQLYNSTLPQLEDIILNKIDIIKEAAKRLKHSEFSTASSSFLPIQMTSMQKDTTNTPMAARTTILKKTSRFVTRTVVETTQTAESQRKRSSIPLLLHTSILNENQQNNTTHFVHQRRTKSVDRKTVSSAFLPIQTSPGYFKTMTSHTKVTSTPDMTERETAHSSLKKTQLVRSSTLKHMAKDSLTATAKRDQQQSKLSTSTTTITTTTITNTTAVTNQAFTAQHYTSKLNQQASNSKNVSLASTLDFQISSSLELKSTIKDKVIERSSSKGLKHSSLSLAEFSTISLSFLPVHMASMQENTTKSPIAARTTIPKKTSRFVTRTVVETTRTAESQLSLILPILHTSILNEKPQNNTAHFVHQSNTNSVEMSSDSKTVSSALLLIQTSPQYFKTTTSHTKAIPISDMTERETVTETDSLTVTAKRDQQKSKPLTPTTTITTTSILNTTAAASQVSTAQDFSSTLTQQASISKNASLLSVLEKPQYSSPIPTATHFVFNITSTSMSKKATSLHSDIRRWIDSTITRSPTTTSAQNSISVSVPFIESHQISSASEYEEYPTQSTTAVTYQPTAIISSIVPSYKTFIATTDMDVILIAKSSEKQVTQVRSRDVTGDNQLPQKKDEKDLVVLIVLPIMGVFILVALIAAYTMWARQRRKHKNSGKNNKRYGSEISERGLVNSSESLDTYKVTGFMNKGGDGRQSRSMSRTSSVSNLETIHEDREPEEPEIYDL